jgi:2-methylisocitrate lyase-like PEP mutase family enzyme
MSGPAALLRELHAPAHRPLVLPNVWDAVSARVFAEAGFPAIATASAAVSASLGYEDGENTPADEMFAAVGRVARAVEVPVSADIEAGYGLDGATLAERLLAAGAAGCNLEDSDPHGQVLLDPIRHAQRIAELRAAAGAALVINARVDVFVPDVEPAMSVTAAISAAIERARRYVDAGADCVYPILAPATALPALVEGIDAPVNALYRPEGPSLTELADLGVARVTFGPGLLRRVIAETRRIAEALRAGDIGA